jgi:hypothetical protein
MLDSFLRLILGMVWGTCIMIALSLVLLWLVDCLDSEPDEPAASNGSVLSEHEYMNERKRHLKARATLDGKGAVNIKEASSAK